jgi:hypothetical protein
MRAIGAAQAEQLACAEARECTVKYAGVEQRIIRDAAQIELDQSAATAIDPHVRRPATRYPLLGERARAGIGSL